MFYDRINAIFTPRTECGSIYIYYTVNDPESIALVDILEVDTLQQEIVCEAETVETPSTSLAAHLQK